MANIQICDIHEDLKSLLRKFKMRKEKDIAAIVMKIDSKTRMVVLEEECEDCTIEDLQEMIPQSQPRYIALSYVYHHEDGRLSYPLMFIFSSPSGCKPELQMMYAGTKLALQKEAEITKAFEIRSADELTDEWLQEKMKFFR